MTQRTVRRLEYADADQALELYNELTLGPPTTDLCLVAKVMDHPGTEIFGAFEGTTLAAMVTLHLMPNALWQGRPYGLIENVVTRASHQKRGFGRLSMEAALAAAQEAQAYKVMLMTGRGRGAVGFYEALGFDSQEKTAMMIRYP